jgi:hypothetical protein
MCKALVRTSAPKEKKPKTKPKNYKVTPPLYSCQQSTRVPTFPHPSLGFLLSALLL